MCFAAQWWEAFGGHVPELQRFAIRILSQTCSASGYECNWSVFERIHTKKRNRLDKKWLNDLVYVQYNLRLRRNHLLNKRPDSDPFVLEDIDPTSDWPVQLNVDPPASVSQPARTPVVGASSAQPEPRQQRSNIATLSQRASTAVAQPSGTTSTVAVGDDDDEEDPWGPLSDFDDDDDPEIDRHDLGSSGSSY
eukprot:PITA_12105